MSGLAVCVGPVNDLLEALDDPQVRHHGMIVEVEGVPVGPGPPLRFADQPADGLRPPPGFGEHTAEALTEIGVGEEELAELRRQGVV